MIKSFDPVFDENCRLLILGSCPSVKSLQKGEYYGHPQNRFWRVMFKLFDEDFTADYAAKKQMLLYHNVGLWDTIGNCIRDGSLDSNIKEVVPNDIEGLIKNSKVQCIALNGGKAKQVFLRQHKNSLQKGDELFFMANDRKIKVVFLPSTSPANARMNFDTLYKTWHDTLKAYMTFKKCQKG